MTVLIYKFEVEHSTICRIADEGLAIEKRVLTILLPRLHRNFNPSFGEKIIPGLRSAPIPTVFLDQFKRSSWEKPSMLVSLELVFPR
jgi:hypothetical protein